MCPAADNECDGAKVLAECFYFSNMAPQVHNLNAGLWKTLETETRDLSIKYDSIHVWCGSVGVARKIRTTSVPTKCWKVIYIKKINKYRAYIFDNTESKEKDINKFKVDINEVKKLTGFIFN